MAPTEARIEIRAGKRRLGSVSRRLGRSGVIHLNRRLGEKQGGKRVRLRIRLPKSAIACPSRRLVLSSSR